MATSTPWGRSQSSKRIARGITKYETGSHGGIKVSKTRMLEIWRPLRNESGWYEEDCEWAKVAFAFPALFTPEEFRAATRIMKDCFPDAYEGITGQSLDPSESALKRERAFLKETESRFVPRSAWGDWHDAVPAGMVGVMCEKRSTGERAWFLVKEEDYSQREPVNEALCQTWENHPQ